MPYSQLRRKQETLSHPGPRKVPDDTIDHSQATGALSLHAVEAVMI